MDDNSSHAVLPLSDDLMASEFDFSFRVASSRGDPKAGVLVREVETVAVVEASPMRMLSHPLGELAPVMGRYCGEKQVMD